MDTDNSFKKLVMPAITLLILLYTVAVAGQNITILIASLLLGVFSFQNRKTINFRKTFDLLQIPFLLCFFFISWQLISTMLGNNSNADVFKAAGGYLGLMFVPILVSFVFHNHVNDKLHYIEKLIFIVCILFGVFSLSQYIVGWKVVGSSFVSEDLLRARGLYSHPLSFAYAVLLLWPYVIVRFFAVPKNWVNVLQVVAILIAIMTSESRTIIGIAMVVFLGNVFLAFSGRVRLSIIGISCILVAGGLSTDNSLSRKIVGTFSEKGFDRNSPEYADDRLVFWHAHYEMIKERPVVGHGMHINTKYRLPYYEKIGMKEFTKPYAAHNMYLQVLANSGIIGIILFGSWVFWLMWKSWCFRNKNIGFKICLQTLAALLIGGLTQNAFQDSVVRYGIMLLVTGIFLLYLNQQNSKEISQ